MGTVSNIMIFDSHFSYSLWNGDCYLYLFLISYLDLFDISYPNPFTYRDILLFWINIWLIYLSFSTNSSGKSDMVFWGLIWIYLQLFNLIYIFLFNLGTHQQKALKVQFLDPQISGMDWASFLTVLTTITNTTTHTLWGKN